MVFLVSTRFNYGIIPATIVLALLLIMPATAVTLTPGDASASSATISNGDSVYINGIATGHPQRGLQVWVLGPNYVKVSTISVNSDNSYSYQLRPSDTMNLAPGQYVVLIQHPMMNGRFDITYDPATGKVINQLTGTGISVFQLTGAGSLQKPGAALALMNAISSPNIDDTFATAAFAISVPDTFIDPIGDHVVGDFITLGGSTNLAVGDDLSVTVYSSSFGPTSKSQSGEFSGTSGIVKVVPGTGGLNRWSFPIDTSAWKPDEYIVTVTGVTVTVSDSANFALLAQAPTTVTPVSTPVMTTIVPETSVPATIPTTVPPATQSPVSVIGITGVLAALVIISQSRPKK